MPYKDPEKSRVESAKRGEKWRARNPERLKAIRKKCYDKYRTKQIKKSRDWYQANKVHCLALLRKRHLLRVYGLTEEQYAALGSACGICGATEDSRVQTKTGKNFRLAVDHEKGTKRVRGLLCGNCNCGIGYFKHDEALMEKAIDYLRRTQ